MGAYHTIELEVNRKFTLAKKSWDSVVLDRIGKQLLLLNFIFIHCCDLFGLVWSIPADPDWQGDISVGFSLTENPQSLFRIFFYITKYSVCCHGNRIWWNKSWQMGLISCDLSGVGGVYWVIAPVIFHQDSLNVFVQYQPPDDLFVHCLVCS